MIVTDEELVSFVDGELEPGRAEALQHAIKADPELARRVAEQCALRDRLRGAFDRVLEEPVPRRLTDLTAADRVMDLQAARMRRNRGAWYGGLGLAAGVVVGLALAPALLRTTRPESDVATLGSAIVAGGALANALSNQLASEQTSSAPVQIGISFAAKSGEYCRTFVTHGESGSVTGMACRHGTAWTIAVLQSEARGAAVAGDYRQAETTLPPVIAQAAETIIDGEPLDAPAEAAARASGWRPARAAR